MKISTEKVQKLQAGGYIDYQPLPLVPEQQQPQQAPQQQEEGKPVEGLDPDILKKMVGEGITTDTLQYSQMVNQAYQQYMFMPDSLKNSFRGKQLRQIMRGDLGQLNMLMRGKKMLDGSIETAKANGALDEVAVTQDGMVGKDLSTGKVTQLTYGDYMKNKDHIKLLTNAELANEREYNPQLTGNSSVFSVLNYGKGIEKVKDEILKIVSTIGTSSKSESTGAFGGDPNNGDANDMQVLEQAAANGAFKIKEGSTVTTNSRQIELAKQTMWNNLSDSGKSVLRARAATLVNNVGQIDDVAKTLAASLLDPHQSDITRSVHDETWKRIAGANGAGANKTADVGPNEAAFLGRSNAVPFGINMPGGKDDPTEGISIQSSGYTLSPSLYTGKDGERTTLQNSPKLAGVARIGQAFTVNGDKVIPANTVITGEAHIAYLPLVKGENGVMKVDQEGVKANAEAEKAFAALPQEQRTPQQRALIQQKYGVNHLNLQRVVVAEAVSYSQHRFSWSDGRDPVYYKPVDAQTEKQVADIVDPKGNGPEKHWGILGGDNTISQHLIIMPAKDALSFREADNNHATLPASVFSMDPRSPNAYNTGNNGANIAAGTTYNQALPPSNYTSDYFHKK